MPWEQAPTIKLDRFIEMRWLVLARENHLGVMGVYGHDGGWCLRVHGGWRKSPSIDEKAFYI